MSNITDRIANLSPKQRAKLLRRLREKEGNGTSSIIESQPRTLAHFPLSFAQQRLWLIEQLQPGLAAYNISHALRMAGLINTAAVKAGFQKLIERHEVLRTTFAIIDDQPVQVIAPALHIEVPLIDLSMLDSSLREEVATTLVQDEALCLFDLEQGPLFRVNLIRLDPQQHILILSQHHIITDAWSLDILSREFAAFYDGLQNQQAVELPPLPIQYADYAAWQRQWLQGATLERHLNYWREQLHGAAQLDMPTDYPRPSVQSHRGEIVSFRFGETLTTQLTALSQQANTTLFVTLMAAWHTLLARYSGQNDVMTGMGIAGRTRKEVEDLIGFFVNTLVIRTSLSGNPTGLELLERVRTVIYDAYTYQDLPFEYLVEHLQPERDLSRHPLVQIMLVLQNTRIATAKLAGLDISTDFAPTNTANFDVSLSVAEHPDGLSGSIEFATDLFEGETIRRLCEHFRQLLTDLVADPTQRLSELSLLSEAERHTLLVDWNATAQAVSTQQMVHTLFEHQVDRNPEAIAVVAGSAALSYSALDARANHLALQLHNYGVTTEIPVVVLMERSPELIVALLAVLKAGGAYVPVDPTYPTERVAFMIEDTQTPVVLTQSSLADTLGSHLQTRVVCLDQVVLTPTSVRPAFSVAPQQAAYVIYTSGSTGTPKGVTVAHENLCNLVFWHQRAYEVDVTDRATLVAGLGFDATVWELWPYLLAGARMALPDETIRLAVEPLLEWLSAMQTTIGFFPTPLAEAILVHGQWPADLALRMMLTGGDVLHRWPDTTLPFTLVNNYGPTENTVVTTWLPLTETGAKSRPPIGHPVDNVQVYVLNDDKHPVPIGVAGELSTGGASLARGYYQRPALTAERFGPNPFGTAPGARLYHTGDRTRWRSTGVIEYFARLDQQVKLRGFRVELGEITATLQQHPAVQEAAVAIHEISTGKHLIAYLVPTLDTELPDETELRVFLRTTLPDYMIPTAFVPLEALPLTPNGKLDRAALPKPNLAIQSGTAYVKPRTPLETQIAAIWTTVLGQKRLGVHDDFFASGGHSLLATQVVSRVRTILKIDLPVRTLFDHPTIAELAAVIAQAQHGATDTPEQVPLVPVPRTAPMPLSYAQQRLWFVEQLQPGTSAYHTFVGLQLQGRLQIAALEQSFQVLLDRHESLRTALVVLADEPHQLIADHVAATLPVIDVSGLPEAQREELAQYLGAEELRHPFDLRQPPLLRTVLVRLQPTLHLLLLNQHHLITDDWSIGIFVHELTTIYSSQVRGEPVVLPPLPIQYADYAVWQRTWLQGAALESQVDYWRKQLADLPTLQLPLDYPRPAVHLHEGAETYFTFDTTLRDKLYELGQPTGATLFMVLLTGWQALLSRYSGQTDIAVGAPIANRTHEALEGLLGFFVNTLVLRTNMDGDPSGAAVLEQVRQTALNAYAHQDVPFEHLVAQIQPDRDVMRQPFFQVSIALQNAPMGALDLPDVQIGYASMGTKTALLELVLQLYETPDGISGRLEYAADLFEAATIERLVQHYERMLTGLVTEPKTALLAIPLLTPAEQIQLRAWNATERSYDAAPSLAHLIAQQAEQTPERIALRSADGVLTFGLLQQQASQLAVFLQQQGVGTETPVAVCLERSLDLFISLVGILYAGGAYVPLDPEYPADRLAFLIQDAATPFIITQTTLHDRLATALTNPALQVVNLDTDWPTIAVCSPLAQLPVIHPQQLAYVIYTSGSTGKPKGAMNAHVGIVNRLCWMQEAYTLTEADRLIQKTPYSFDVSVWELFWSLLTGASVVIAVPGGHQDPVYLGDVIEQERVTIVHFVPSMLNAFLESAPTNKLDGVREVVCSGEALTLDLQTRFFAYTPSSLHNLYGPTEAAVDVTAWECCASESLQTVPIGYPIANTQILILGPSGDQVPVGIPGELYIGGVQVARGYHRRPGLTAERFVPDSQSNIPGSRAYRTGDLVRYGADGAIEYLGRLDHQIKMRGLRIELGEIEAALYHHEWVQTAVVLAREDIPGDMRLTGYLVPHANEIETNENGANGASAEHVDYWQTFYDETYSEVPVEALDDPTFNIVGWASSYTNQPIPAEEMREWVQTTVARIQSGKPQCILEVGCGTGLLLFPLAPDCQRYVGVDFSATALDYIRQHLDPTWSHVELYEQRADDLTELAGQMFDVVVINSVVQYFPSVNYLLDALTAALPLVAPGGRIFLGDVRNLTLLESFAAAVQLAQAPAGLPRAELRQRVLQHMAREEELVIDSQLFYQLPAQFPQISGVQVEIKRGWAHNELSQFRYDVTLWVGENTAVPVEPQDWNANSWTAERVQRILAQEQPTWLALCGVPSARLVGPTTAVKLLVDPTGPATVAGVREVLGRTSGIEPETFWQLGEELGYQVLVSWDETNIDGSYTVVFGPADTGPFVLPTLDTGSTNQVDWNSYANHPAWEAAQIARLPHLRQYLSTRLPEYMVPSALIPLQRLPLTPNGKLDRQALPMPSNNLRGSNMPFVAPRTPTEDVVATIWARLLNQTQVGIHDDFFDMGGHSLLATRVIAQIRDVFGVELPVRALFETPILREFAQQVVAAQRAHTTRVAPPLVAQPRTGADLPVSFAQQRLWFVQHLEPLSIAYHMPNIVRLRGAIDLGVLIQSLGDVVTRQESLRTAFPEVNGQPVQRITPPGPVSVPCIDLRELEGNIREQIAREQIHTFTQKPFNLAHGPLFRTAIWRISNDDIILVFILHHIIGDGWSQGILLSDLSAFYTSRIQKTALEIVPLPIQYADYAVWQRQWLHGAVLDSQVAYWRRQLADLPTLQLPTDYPRPAVPSYRGADLRVLLEPDLANQVRALAQQMNGTLFMVVLAAWQLLLARYSGQDDIVVGMGIAGRTHVETDPLIGFFVNTLVLRTDMYGQPTAWEVLERVRTVTLNAYAHQDVPFEEVVTQVQPERDLSRQPLFQVAIVLQNTPRPTAEVSSVQILPMAIENQTAKFDLTLDLTETPLGLMGRLEYATDLYEAATIERLWGHYRTLLTGLVSDPEMAITTLSLLSNTERQQLLVDWNRTHQSYEVSCIHERFAAQVRRTPDAIACVDGTQHLSYAALDGYSNYVAQHLHTFGAKNEVPIAVLIERSSYLLTALLGVLKSGNAYIPLDPNYPAERVAFILQDTRAPIILTSSTIMEQFTTLPSATAAVCLDQLLQRGTPTSLCPSVDVSSNQAAYIIYTSGSTGTPKGVVVSHANLLNLVEWHQRVYAVTCADRTTIVAGLAFDAAVWELWPYLLAGARIALPNDTTRTTVEPLLTWLAAEQITIAFFPTPLAEAMLAHEEWPVGGRLRMLLTGGDVLHRWPDQSLPFTVVNNYGPTENTVVTTWLPLTEPDTSGLPPIGHPVDNAQVYILDQYLSPTPMGVPGELYIGGASLTRGYLLRPELTAEKFVPDSFGSAIGSRLYRTGDLVRYQSTGAIEFLGRIDHQVKLRGYRIELGEIEATLQQHPAVNDAVVLAHEDVPGDKRLVAYLVPTSKNTDTNGSEDAYADEHVAHWQSLYDETYEDTTPVALTDPTFNIIGWNSSYTNAPLPAEDMREWVDTTVARIASRNAQRILEIGCGTGLLLFPLAQQCTQYVGVDFSATAIDYIRRHLDPEWQHVTLYQRRADDLPNLGQQQFDTVILNSIIQYFPSIDYLLTVIEQAIPYIAPGGQLFIGDIRNLPLLELFITATQTHQATHGLPIARLHQRIRQQVAMERELVIDPAFFYALPQRFPQISGVQVELKRGVAHNELTQFRYDATLTINGPPPSFATGPIHEWSADEWTMERVCMTLREDAPAYMQLRGVPNRRLSSTIHNRDLLSDVVGPTSVRALQEAITACEGTGIDPEQFWYAAAATGYQIMVTWSPHDFNGSYDVLFYPETETSVQLDMTDTAMEWSHYANRPVWDDSQHDLIPQLRQYLATQLPEYMVPSAYMVLNTLPLTRNGKVDRRALPAPDQTQIDSGQYVAPQTRLETDLVAIWEEVLGITRISVTDDFFILGGHSLLATQVVSRIRSAYGTDLSVRVLFEHPTIAQLTQVMQEAQHSDQTVALPPLVPVSRAEPIPLSFAQQRLWFIDQLQPGMANYHIFAGLHLQGELNIATLTQSFQDIVQRHESLRTTFTVVDDQPLQVIAPTLILDIPVVDASGLSHEDGDALILALAQHEALRPFDLTQGPLLRIMLIQVTAQECVMLVNQHHIVTDGWSLGIFIRELTTLYASKLQQVSPALPSLPVQYPDYAAWQHSWLHGDILADQLAYWRQQLAGQQVLQLPTDYSRPPMPTYRGDSVPIVFERAFVDQLQSLSHQSGITLFMTMLAGWQALLTRYSGQDDIVVGSPIAGRTHAALEHLIGFFVNTLVLRTDLHGNPTGLNLLQRVQDVTLDAYAQQDVPFEYLVAELQPQRDLSRQPLYQVMFVLQNMPTADLDLHNIQISPLNVGTMTTQVDLTLHLNEVDTYVVGRLEYALDLFEHATIERFVKHYHTLLQGLIHDPTCRLFDLPLLTAVERQQMLVAWNDTYCAVDAAYVHEQFASQARQTPNAPAVMFRDEILSYEALDQAANQLAWYLLAHGVGPDVSVGVCLARQPAVLMSILGILKAGGTYVPLDPTYPSARLSFIISDTRMPVLLTDSVLEQQIRLTGAGLDVICVDTMQDTLAMYSSHVPELAVVPEQLAYIIYTSGSTGTPKGVMVTHSGLRHYLTWATQTYPFRPGQQVPVHSSLAFDLTITSLLAPLTMGGTVRLLPEGSGVETLGALLQDENDFGVIKITPAHLAVLQHQLDASQAATKASALVIGGEQLTSETLAFWQQHAPATLLINEYGPTETVVGCCVHAVAATEQLTGSVPIGRPIANTQLYALDVFGQPVPIGAAGELYIGGAGIARGYVQRAGVTATHFVPNGFSDRPGTRLYRTGDMVRYRADGVLEFLGRTDQQVKVHGYRIELGEIENVLQQQPAVRDAVVLVWDDTMTGPQLVGYVVPQDTVSCTTETLREHVQSHLPEYMTPHTFVMLEALPLTPNGKLDYAALPVPVVDRSRVVAAYEAPRTAVEQQLAEIWQDVLGMEQVGVDDNFFELGGHSLLLTQVHRRIREQIAPELLLVDLFRYPTIASLAAAITQATDHQRSLEKSRTRATVRAERTQQRQQQRQTRQQGRAKDRKT
ncbi:MAG: non-ribosomal peptide synthase/polyketide synthase [Chloroflexota bacterium]